MYQEDNCLTMKTHSTVPIQSSSGNCGIHTPNRLGRLGAAHVQVVSGERQPANLPLIAECRCKRLIYLESDPHLISVSKTLDDKWCKGIITVQMGLEPHCHAVEVRTAHFQILTPWASSHLFTHLLTVAFWQPASPHPARHLPKSCGLNQE